MHGIISREEYDYLTDTMKYRNAIARGCDVNGFSDEKVMELFGVVARLLDSKPEVVWWRRETVCNASGFRHLL